MSLSGYHTVAFSERGVRTDEQGITCNGALSGSDGVEVCKTTVRLDDADSGVEGEVWRGQFWWRCFSGYVERVPADGGVDAGVLALLIHTKDGRMLLAATAPGEVPPEVVDLLTGEFFDRACDALEVDRARVASMRRAFAFGGAR